jgi:hypothetical protein
MSKLITSMKVRILRVVNRILWPMYFRRFTTEVRAGRLPSDALLNKLVYHWGNSGWSADFSYLKLLLKELLESRNRTVLECGSGLTTVLLGVVADLNAHRMFSLEHHPEWRERISRALASNGVRNATVHFCPLKDYGDFEWYDVSGLPLPDEAPFNLVICDGPPANTKGGRVGLPYVFASRLQKGCVIVADDTHRPAERAILDKWMADFAMVPDDARSMQHFRSLVVE